MGDLQKPRQNFWEVAAIVGGTDRRFVGHGVNGYEIAPPDFGPVEPKHMRGFIGEPFQHIASLGTASPAISVGRQCVGEYPGRLRGDRRRSVHARQQRRIDRTRDRGPEGRDIGAKVGDGVDPECEEVSLAIERELRVGLMIARLIVGNEALAARRDPFDRPPQFSRGPGNDGLLGIMLPLVAEAATDVGRNQADRRLRQIELLADDAADVMWHLRRTIQRELASCAAVGKEGARLQRRADQAIVDEIKPHHVRRTGKDFGDRSLIAAREPEADIARRCLVKLRRIRCQSGPRVGHRGQRLIIDLDEVGGIAGLRQRFSNDQCDGFADVADPVARQRPAWWLGHRFAVG